ncbi:MAG: hypothetical protein WA642_03310, partial [Steroidobacteraceae bacterium]
MRGTPLSIRANWMVRSLLWCFLTAGAPAWAAAPLLEFHAPASADDPGAAAAMRDLAGRLVPVFQDPDPDRYLANLSALQMAADNFTAADVSRQALRDRQRRANVHRPVGRGLIYDIYAYAKALEAENRVSFADGFTRAFHEVVGRLGDHDAYAVTRWLELPVAVFREDFQKTLDQQRTNDTIGQAEAVELIWKFLSYNAY